jgi:hypothetical protein
MTILVECNGRTEKNIFPALRFVFLSQTVQIMIGLMMLLTGIVMAMAPWLDNIGVVSGIFVWGSIIVSELLELLFLTILPFIFLSA